MQSLPFPRYLVPPRSKYSSQHHVLKYTQLPFLPQYQRPSFTPIKINRQNYISLNFWITTRKTKDSAPNDSNFTFNFTKFLEKKANVLCVTNSIKKCHWKLLSAENWLSFSNELESGTFRLIISALLLDLLVLLRHKTCLPNLLHAWKREAWFYDRPEFTERFCMVTACSAGRAWSLRDPHMRYSLFRFQFICFSSGILAATESCLQKHLDF